MAAFGFNTIAVGNSLPCGIRNIVIDILDGTPHVATLTDLSETNADQTFVSGKNQHGMERAQELLAEASWKWHLADGVYIPLLSTFISGFHNTVIELINGDFLIFGNTTVGHNGVAKCKLTIDDSRRDVEMSIKRQGAIASATASIWDHGILFSTGTSAGGTTLFTGGASYRSPSGIKTFGVRNTGETNYETIGAIKSASFTAMFNCDEDSEKRYNPKNTVAIEYMVEIMDYSPTSLAVLPLVAQAASTDCKFTLIDNVVVTCADILGCIPEAKALGDVDKGATIRVHGSGEILTSAWAGLFS